MSQNMDLGDVMVQKLEEEGLTWHGRGNNRRLHEVRPTPSQQIETQSGSDPWFDRQRESELRRGEVGIEA
jgi:hypothetical protein